MHTYGVGTLAYIDSFGGLIPCTVVEIHKPCNGVVIGHDELTVEVNETRCGYQKGERVKRSAVHTPPRNRIVKRQYSSRISNLYQYK